MKTKVFYVLFMLCLAQFARPEKADAQANVNFQVFYDELSPYGTWVNNPEYGYVWSPNLGADFVPYGTNGYWTYTADGWTWVSDYEWGWAPFHYGRWFTDDVYGPMWIPDYEWGPGWVSWRESGGYYGWAPLGPRMEAGYDGHDIPLNRWRFVDGKDMGRKDLQKRFVNTSRNPDIFKNSTALSSIRTDNVRNVKYNPGPDREKLEGLTGKKIQPVMVKENDKPGQRMDKNQLNIYRPQVQQNNVEPRPMPSRVGRMEDLTPRPQRMEGGQGGGRRH